MPTTTGTSSGNPQGDGSKITGRLLNLAVSAGLLVVALVYGVPLV